MTEHDTAPLQQVRQGFGLPRGKTAPVPVSSKVLLKAPFELRASNVAPTGCGSGGGLVEHRLQGVLGGVGRGLGHNHVAFQQDEGASVDDAVLLREVGVLVGIPIDNEKGHRVRPAWVFVAQPGDRAALGLAARAPISREIENDGFARGQFGLDGFGRIDSGRGGAGRAC